MKKFKLVIFCLVLGLSLSACARSNEEDLFNGTVEEENVESEETAVTNDDIEKSIEANIEKVEDIGEEQAKTIALEKVFGAGEEDITIYADREEDKLVYKGTIRHGGKAVEFTIDGLTGAVIDWEDEKQK